MRGILVVIIYFGLISLGYSQYSVIIKGGTTNPSDNRTVIVFINGVQVVNTTSNSMVGLELYSKDYDSACTNIIVKYGQEQSKVNFNTLSEGGYNDIFVNTSAYGSIPVIKVYYQTPNTKIITGFFHGTDIDFNNIGSFCAGDHLSITYKDTVPIYSKYFEFEAANGTTLGTAFKESYSTQPYAISNYPNDWDYSIPEPTTSGEKRFFRGRRKRYISNVVDYTLWTNYQLPISLYHSRPKIALLNTYATCSSIGFVISVSGAKSASNDIEFYSLQAYTLTTSGYLPLQFSNGNTVFKANSNGIYTFTGNSFLSSTSLGSGMDIKLTFSNHYQTQGDQCPAPDIFFTMPYPAIDVSNIVSISTPLKSNGFNLSYHGSNDGEITIIGNNISSILLDNDQTGFYLTKTGNKFTGKNVREGTYNVTYSDNLNCQTTNYQQPSITFTAPEQLKLVYNAKPILNCNGNITSGDFTASVVQVSDNAPPLTNQGYVYNYKVYHGVCCGAPIMDVTTTASSIKCYNLTSSGYYFLWVSEVGKGNIINNSSVSVPIPETSSLVTLDSLFPNYNAYNLRCNGNSGNVVYTFSGFTWAFTPYQTTVKLDGNVINTWQVVTVAGSTGFLIVSLNATGGSHTLDINNTYNCAFNKNFILTQPQVTSFTGFRTVIPNTCFGSSNAVYEYTISGGIPPFNNIKLWPRSGGPLLSVTTGVRTYPDRTNTFTGVPNGYGNVYEINLGADGNGCTYPAVFPNYQAFLNFIPDPITFATSSTGVICKGDQNGSVFPASITGGNGQYFATVYNSQSQTITTLGNTMITNLPEDTYRIYIYDQKGCASTPPSLFATVTGPANPLTITALGTVTQPSCYQSNDGELYFTATGGWPGTYTFQSAPYQHINRNKTLTNINVTPSNVKIGNASRGDYLTSVTDSKGCKRSISSFLPSPDSMIVSVKSFREPNCAGENNGQITLTATGGSGIYRYSVLNNGFYKTSPVKDTLTAGTYSFSAKDSKNCISGIGTVELMQPQPLKVTIVDTLFAACHQSIGGVTFAGVGGTAPYQAAWKDTTAYAYTSFSRAQIKSGIYRIYISDAHNCKDSSSVSIRDVDGPKIKTTHTFSPSCSYTSNGKIEITAIEEGSRPFTYTWSSGTTYNDSIAFNLSGNKRYSVLVTDRYNCKGGMDIDLSAPAPLTMKIQNLHDPACFGYTDGSIELLSEGGSVPYQYFTTGNTGQSSNTITGLSSGVYQLITKDQHDCTVTGQAGLSEPATYQFSFYPDNATICPGQKYKLQSPVISKAYEWSGPNGFTASTENITTKGQGTYTLTVYNEKGCPATDQYAITESSSILEANFLVKGEVSVGDTVVIVELSWPKPENISWNLPTQFNVVKVENEYAYVVPTEAGSFEISLDATLGDCSNEKSKTVRIISRDEAKKENYTATYWGPRLLYIYPNPTEGELNVYLEFAKESDVFVQVLDISGNEVISTRHFENKALYNEKLDTSFLQPGMYAVKINSQDYQKVLKFVKM